MLSFTSINCDMNYIVRNHDTDAEVQQYSNNKYTQTALNVAIIMCQ